MCQLGPGASFASLLGSHQMKSSTTLRSFDCRPKMGSHSRKRSSPKSSKQPSLSSLEVSAATGVPANLDSSPQSSDGRPTTHRIDTHGSVQALVVDNDIVIAGLQDGRLAVSHLRSIKTSH
jgi:hypothetical protein